jgi:DNA replication protein DnaC
LNVACPLCDDTGWKPIDVDGVRRVTRCDCWRDKVGDTLLADARIPRRYQHCDLDTFITYPNERLLSAVARSKRFAEQFPVVDKGLFFIGSPGIGKTHLAVAILRQVIRTRGARGLFYDTRDLLKVIRSTYDPTNRTSESDVLRPVMTAELLVLDDLGAEKTSDWVDETLNLIVNTRYNERRATIFTSNFEEKEDRNDPESLLVRVGFRMHSRLYEMCEFLEFDGADYRHAEPNSGPNELLALWKNLKRPGRLPSRSGGPVRAQLREPRDRGGDTRADLKWTGGKAGS